MIKTDALTEEILRETYLLSLATKDNRGIWVADLIFVSDDAFNLYWISKPFRRHSMAIHADGEVAATITLTDGPEMPDKGLQIHGTAELVKEVPTKIIERYLRKRKKDTQPEDGWLGEHKWYKLTPDQIELIYQPEYGYERQQVL
jgi:uncharacterized protein YhbP (UPF0306 family)